MSQESLPSKTRHLDPAGYLSTKTITALCTPTGGAICILRISGADAFKIASSLVGQSDLGEERKAKKVTLKDHVGKTLDEAVLVRFIGPRSFTGEDIVELYLHGSPIVAQKVIDEICSYGARLALPGEFSFRGVKNGKLNLSQAEAIKELVKADNDFALDLALEKLSGSQHALLIQIRDELMQLVTLAEAGIDFSDQDLDEVSLPRLKERLNKVEALLKNLGGSFERGKRFADGIPVSIFGLPNAGKSSFFNALLGEDRSIVSDIAGTTRDIVKEKIHLKGKQGTVSFKVADTAGLRKSTDAIEEIGIERSLKSARDADLVILVVDGKSPDLDFLKTYTDQIKPLQKQWLGVITKSDLLSVKERDTLLQQVKSVLGFDGKWVLVSALKLEGISEITESMTAIAETLLARNPGEVVLTQFEHVQAVEHSLESLNRAKNSMDIVLFATDVRHAMNDLGPLLGETVPDDVLSKIFSDFCIGK